MTSLSHCHSSDLSGCGKEAQAVTWGSCESQPWAVSGSTGDLNRKPPSGGVRAPPAKILVPLSRLGTNPALLKLLCLAKIAVNEDVFDLWEGNIREIQGVNISEKH